jgi:hypothetical protein
MGEGMKSISYPVSRFPEFAKLPLLVREEVSSTSNQFPLACDQLFGDCTYGKLRQHSPNCENRHDSVESHDQLKLLAQSSKRIAHHREQKVHGEKVELRDDKEFEQI